MMGTVLGAVLGAMLGVVLGARLRDGFLCRWPLTLAARCTEHHHQRARLRTQRSYLWGVGRCSEHLHGGRDCPPNARTVGGRSRSRAVGSGAL